jgi:exopolysaccharide biosynthesis polyprenyl glycosylphosphotransferase
MSAGEQVLARPVEDACLPVPADRVVVRPRAAVVRRAARQVVAAGDRRLRCALLGADLTAAAVAATLAGPPGGAAAVALVVLLAWLHGLHGDDGVRLRRTTLDEAPRVLQVVVLATLLLGFAAGTGAARMELVVFATVLLVATLAARTGARALVASTLPVERCLFVGDAAEYERLRGKLAARGLRAELAGRLALRGGRDDGGSSAAGAASAVALGELLRETGAHRVVIDAHALAPAELLDIVHAAEELGLRVSVLPHAVDVAGGRAVAVDDLDGLTVVGLRRFGLPRSARAAKRAFDLVLAGAGLVVAGPLMAAIGLAILIDSGGPVLFRQARMGRGDRPFQILKFRTMHPDAAARHVELRRLHGLEEELFKLERDPRVTRVGRVLRATSLDELPQLVNVLRGEMSLVGPRPLVLDEDARIAGPNRRRLHLTPGMTGSWQIAAGRVPLGEMVEIDRRYIAGWSLWADVKILLRTVPHVLGRRGM